MANSQGTPVSVAQTIDAPIEPPAANNRSPRIAAPRLVQGSTPGLGAEIDILLAERLRAAALVLLAGFGMFLFRRLFELDLIVGPLEWTLFWMHCAMTFIAGFIALRMCMGCHYFQSKARITEAILFGSTTIFFSLVSYSLLLRGAEHGYLGSIAPMWMLLIFIYAIFIPNTWQRAGVVTSLFAMVAIGVLVIVGWTSPEYQVVTLDASMRPGVVESGMVLVLSACAATWGVFALGRLRLQAYEAKQLGQYRLKRPLGSGGMGEVFLAEHMMLKRPCAIKLIRAEKAGDPQALERFEREVQSTAKLSHWNTVEIFDYGHSDDGTFYYAMEYLPGMNLEQIIEMYGPMSSHRVVYLLSQVCDALAEAHAAGLVHRDIKPANIFVAHRGGIFDVVKLLDFGLVKPVVATDDRLELTSDGSITGSPLFLSPEQALGETVGPTSDIYSIGAVAYYMLTGRPPFEAQTTMKVLVAHAHEPPRLPSQWVSDLPEALERIVMRCLEKSPADRFASVEELSIALRESRLASDWNRALAKDWWQDNGCPDKKKLDADVMELACP